MEEVGFVVVWKRSVMQGGVHPPLVSSPLYVQNAAVIAEVVVDIDRLLRALFFVILICSHADPTSVLQSYQNPTCFPCLTLHPSTHHTYY